jgi:hypothetical protein
MVSTDMRPHLISLVPIDPFARRRAAMARQTFYDRGTCFSAAYRVALTNEVHELVPHRDQTEGRRTALHVVRDLQPDLVLDFGHLHAQVADLLAYFVQLVVHAPLERKENTKSS